MEIALRIGVAGTAGNMKALFAQAAPCSPTPILPPAALPAIPARGGALWRAERTRQFLRFFKSSLLDQASNEWSDL